MKLFIWTPENAHHGLCPQTLLPFHPLLRFQNDLFTGSNNIKLSLRVFEKRVLRRIFGPKRDEVTGGWRKIHNEELHNLYSSPSIIRMMKSRRMRWAGHVA
jgi:hypothetical protein